MCAGDVLASNIGYDLCQYHAPDEDAGQAYYFSAYCDANNTATFGLYADESCRSQFMTYSLDQCYGDDLSGQVNDTVWLGSYLRAKSDTVMMLVGLMTNELNASSFHDVYLPFTTTYTDPTSQLDFLESSLVDTGLAWMPDGDDPDLFSKLFVAQWTVAHTCLSPPSAVLAAGQGCLSTNFMDLPDVVQVQLLSRQYLDPQTLTGPSGALPRHRWLVFDRQPGSPLADARKRLPNSAQPRPPPPAKRTEANLASYTTQAARGAAASRAQGRR